MATYDWPADLRPEGVEWGRVIPQVGARSAFDGSLQTQPLGAPRWQFTIDTGRLQPDEVPRWEAWIDKLDGMQHRARTWDWRREAPLGVATGTPLVRVSAAGSTLASKGWTASTSGILLRGSWLGVNGELKRLVADADSDASGFADLVLWPPLRSAPAVDAPLVITKPTALFVCTTLVGGMRQTGGRHDGGVFAFEEVFA